MMLDHSSKQISNYHLQSTTEVILTSERGDRLAIQDNIRFTEGYAEGNVIHVYPESKKQALLGIGSSFTESSAFVLAHLDEQKRSEILKAAFSEHGANFSMARSPIGSCDFCVEGRYSYADQPLGDKGLGSFSIAPDLDGFDPQRYPGITDPSFDLLPMIQQAMRIKKGQTDQSLRIIASAWTAPPWMKDTEDWFCPGSAENQHAGTGGVLKPEHYSTYAEYLTRYLDAYREKGIDIWGITPVNEPLGNNGQWESMHFTAKGQKTFIKNHLGPGLKNSGNGGVNLLFYDHNRDQLEEWADIVYGDSETSTFVYGAAVHWYQSSFRVYEDTFDRVHNKHPDLSIIHTEGCIDDLGNEAPAGVLDPAGYKESNWFDNDDFWWNDNATDWAYTATWPGVDSNDHPAYTPVHRYARDIIVGLDHWVSGWIDWNLVLDQRGGPNHVENYCGAPIMVDLSSGYVYYTPVYYILAQLSKTMRPGDRVVKIRPSIRKRDARSIFSCAALNAAGLLSVQLLNTSKHATLIALQIGNQYAQIEAPANALLTVRLHV